MLSRTKIHINAAYGDLREYIKAVPSEQYDIEHVYCDGRNLVARVRMGDKLVVLKKYKCPNILKRIMYTWFRKSKAERAFIKATQLEKSGIETAKPIAYVLTYQNSLLHTCYFISEYLPYRRMNEVYDSLEKPLGVEPLWTDFVDFVYGMHAQKIYQRDNNSGNYLVHKVGLHYRFALVDINRVRFGKVPTLRESMQVFEHQNISVKELVFPISLYAAKRGFSEDECVYYMLSNRRRLYRRKAFKHFRQKVKALCLRKQS